MRPTENNPLYPTAKEPAEDFFQLEDPLQQLRERRPINVEDLPPLPLPSQPDSIPPGSEQLPIPPQQ
jgi:hypothetical protein